MCRSIKVLRRPEAPATSEEVSAAALQFVLQPYGYRWVRVRDPDDVIHFP